MKWKPRQRYPGHCGQPKWGVLKRLLKINFETKLKARQRPPPKALANMSGHAENSKL